jgi:hypothetical protein
LLRRRPAAGRFHELGADRAELEALPDHGGRDTKPRGDILGGHAFLMVQLGKRLELVGRVHRRPDDVFGEADLMGIVVGIENAAHRLGLFDLLALGAKQMREPPPLPDGDDRTLFLKRDILGSGSASLSTTSQSFSGLPPVLNKRVDQVGPQAPAMDYLDNLPPSQDRIGTDCQDKATNSSMA